MSKPERVPFTGQKGQGADAYFEPAKPKKRRFVPATFHYYDDQLDWLDGEAKQRDVPKAEIVREALDAYIAKQEGK